MAEPDLYAVLGVARGAAEDEIRKAYRKLAREHHPDVNPNDPKAEERFKEISFAYDVLADPEKRKLYDEFGRDGLAHGFDPEQARSYQRWSEGMRHSPFGRTFQFEGGTGDLGDLFGDLFGPRAGRRRGPARGEDIEGEVRVDFLDAVRGGEVRVQLESGGSPGQTRTLRVKIPPGADDGTRVRLAGQGQPGRQGGPAGDLYLKLRVRPHRLYRRDGLDLHLDLPVTVPELILGAAVQVPTPEGPVTMTIPPRSQNGQKLRLRGRGVPRARGEGRGDLIVHLIAELPREDDARLVELARELETFYQGRDPRRDLEGSG